MTKFVALRKVFTRRGALLAAQVPHATTFLAASLLRLPVRRAAVVAAEGIGVVLPEGLALLRR